MKNLILISCILLISLSSFGQSSKTIIITNLPKIVPAGKKWILEAGKTTRVQVTEGVLNSGSLCNAQFTSIPRMIANVNSGKLFKGDNYMIIFKDPEKVPYTNDYTIDLTVLAIIDKNFNPSDLKQNKIEDLGAKKLEFKAGESVFVGLCLRSIELKEINMTQAELLEIKKNENIKNNESKLKLSNFSIPINPEKYVEPNTIPEYHDKNLRSITFSSPAVLHVQTGKPFSADQVSKWTLTLDTEKFVLVNTSGIDKTYYVLKVEYDSKRERQKFILGNNEKVITHNLYISWSNSSNEYSLILSSIDQTDEYQFQEVQSTQKQFQNE